MEPIGALLIEFFLGFGFLVADVLIGLGFDVFQLVDRKNAVIEGKPESCSFTFLWLADIAIVIVGKVHVVGDGPDYNNGGREQDEAEQQKIGPVKDELNDEGVELVECRKHKPQYRNANDRGIEIEAVFPRKPAKIRAIVVDEALKYDVEQDEPGRGIQDEFGQLYPLVWAGVLSGEDEPEVKGRYEGGQQEDQYHSGAPEATGPAR